MEDRNAVVLYRSHLLRLGFKFYQKKREKNQYNGRFIGDKDVPYKIRYI